MTKTVAETSEVSEVATDGISDEVAAEIATMLAAVNTHYREMLVFYIEKLCRVTADDMVWLTESVTEEERLAMWSETLEKRRLALFERVGIAGYNADRLVGGVSDGYKSKLRLECDNLIANIYEVKKVSSDILTLIEKKLRDNEPELRKAGISGALGAATGKYGTYGKSGKKVAHRDTGSGVIGSL